MKHSGIFSTLIIVIAVVLFNTPVLGWDNEVTHKDLTGYAADHSILNTGKGNFLHKIDLEDLNKILLWSGQVCDDKSRQTNCSIKDWLKYGAKKEDEEKWIPALYPSLRWMNHFHEPIDNRELHGPAIDVFKNLFNITNQSALEWAQDSAGQAAEIEGDQSWEKVRTLFREALITTNATDRQTKFAQMFKALGHQMHVVQDMAVPAHVRNDAHGEDALQGESLYKSMWVRKTPLYFENWAVQNDWMIKNLAQETSSSDYPLLNYETLYAGYPVLVPVSQLWDADFYDGTNPSATAAQGLAEYTNANFFSEDTLFAAEEKSPGDPHYFPYPKKTSTTLINVMDLLPRSFLAEDGQLDYKLYIDKHYDGQEVTNFVRVGYFASILNNTQYVYNRAFYLDEACHQAYAEKLVPRAVGYSAALLDYFFRGTLTIRHPFVKLKAGTDGIAIGGFEFEVQNSTAGEDLASGNLELVYRYRPVGSDEPVYGRIDDAGIVLKSTGQPYFIDTADAAINTGYVRLSADLAPGAQIPVDADELVIMLVYSGTLGAEADIAVAVGSQRFDAALLDGTTRLAFYIQRGGKGAGFTNPSNIYSVLSDGDDLRNLTGLPETPVSGAFKGYFAPAFSPDGRLLAFDRELCLDPQANPPYPNTCADTDYFREIVVLDMSAGLVDPDNPLTVLTYPATSFPDNVGTEQDPPASLYNGSFAPDNQHLVCLIQDPWAGGVNLGVFDVATGDGVHINGWSSVGAGYWNPKNLFGSLPVWSPDGEQIAYYIHCGNNEHPETMMRDIYTIQPQVYRIDGVLTADGTGDSALTSDSYFNTQPAWSPDGQWIVFSSDRAGNGRMDLWLMDRNGQNLQLIYRGQMDCISPGFSPDGRRIGFVQGDSICSVNLAGQDFQIVTSTGNTNDLINELSWSPFLDEYAPSVSLSADPPTASTGQSVTLTWTSHNADRIVLDNGLGEQQDLSGSVIVTAQDSTVYTITAYNWAGRVTATANVTVGSP